MAVMTEEAVDGLEVGPQYNYLSDNLRRCAPSGLQCSVFCGGRRCKYETPESWDSTHMAVRGVYSHWVTDDILAMARPCTEIINKRNIIKQFKSLGVRSVVNLQQPGEHRHCGCPLESSGFTYDPAVFMDNGIYYYNYAWQDYGEVKVSWLLDMVKIICHGMSEGKLAIHCHAGLGRTGVLIACFLVYSRQMRADEAIKFVRLKRPNSVQSRGQILCVQHFERLLLKQPKVPEVTLPHYVLTQKVLLHGYEARCIQHIPKIMYVVCERLLQLCECPPVATIPEHHHAPTTLQFITANRNPCHYHHINSLITLPSESQVSTEELHSGTVANENENESEETKRNTSPTDSGDGNTVVRYTPQEVVEAMIVDPEDMTAFQRRSVVEYQASLSHSESYWQSLQSECRPVVLAGLLTDWMEQLKSPIIDCQLLCQIVIHADDPLHCLRKFEFVTQYTVEYLFRFVAHLSPLSREDVTFLIQRLVASLTQQSVVIRGNLVPREKEFGKLRRGTYRKMMEFSSNLLDQIEKHITENASSS